MKTIYRKYGKRNLEIGIDKQMLGFAVGWGNEIYCKFVYIHFLCFSFHISKETRIHADGGATGGIKVKAKKSKEQDDNWRNTIT